MGLAKRFEVRGFKANFKDTSMGYGKYRTQIRLMHLALYSIVFTSNKMRNRRGEMQAVSEAM